MSSPSAPAPARKRTLYDILGVERDANAIDIGIAYKAKIEALNRNPGADPNEANLVHEAYHVLCMPNERAAYDAKLISMAEKAAARERDPLRIVADRLDPAEVSRQDAEIRERVDAAVRKLAGESR